MSRSEVGNEASLRCLPSGDDSRLLLRAEELGVSLLELIQECREQLFLRRQYPVLSNPDRSNADHETYSLCGTAAEQEQNSLVERLAEAEGTLAEFMQTVRRFHELAWSDALTGLPNRRAFDDHVDRMVADTVARPVSLVLMDIDAFKQINDRLGHDVGDQVLRTVADCLREGAGEGAMVARFGGEEFAMLVCESGEMAVQRVDRCRSVLERRSGEWAERGLVVRFSAGVAALSSEERVGDWFRRTDLALYAAKRLGRDRVVLHEGEHLNTNGNRIELRSWLGDGVGVTEGFMDWQRAERVAERLEAWRIEAISPEYPDLSRGISESGGR